MLDSPWDAGWPGQAGVGWGVGPLYGASLRRLSPLPPSWAGLQLHTRVTLLASGVMWEGQVRRGWHSGAP